MDQKIIELKRTTFFGKRFTRRQLSDMQQTVDNFPALSRRELAQTICEHLNWKTAQGDNRYQACLQVLEHLEQLGLWRLPPKQPRRPRGKNKPLEWTERSAEQARIEGSLSALLPLQIQLVASDSERRLWNELVDRHHYLGYQHPMGPNLRYFIFDAHGRRLGCVGFSQATQRLRCRDEWIGWQGQKYKKHLNLVVNNHRFLILPWVKVNNLASKALSLVLSQLAADWKRQQGLQPVLVETFVEEPRYAASSYRAVNFERLGLTQKRRGKTQKTVYVYALEAQAKTILVSGRARVRRKKARAPAPVPAAAAGGDETFGQFWQQLITIITEVAAEFDARWQQRKRVLNTLLVMLFVFRLVLSARKVGYQSVLNEFWQQCEHLEVPLPQPRPVSAAAMCKARQKVDAQVFKLLHRQVLRQCQPQLEPHRWQDHHWYAIDGSKLNLPRRLQHAGYPTPNSQAHYPQGLLSCLYQLRSKVPVDFELAAHHHERKLALQHLKVLGPGDVVVYDRGDYSYELLHEHWRRQIDVIFRMPYHSFKLIDQFMRSEQVEQTVAVTPRAEAVAQIRRRHPAARGPPLSLRLVKYYIGGKSYTLATTLHDAQRFSSRRLARVYHSRWGVEELYKTAKQHLSLKSFHGQSERHVKQELYAHFVLITWMRLFTHQAEKDLPGQTLTEEQEHTRRVNFKNAIEVLSRSLEGLVLQQADWVRTTVQSLVEQISQCYYKVRPDRSYPRQSKQPQSPWGRSGKRGGGHNKQTA